MQLLCAPETGPVKTQSTPMTSHWPKPRSEYRRGDRGSITLFVIVMFIAIAAAAGLVIDGGTKLRTAREASAVAEEAARAGAGQIDRSRAYRDGRQFVIDPQAAISAARSYLSRSGDTGSVSVTGAHTIRVTVTISRPTALLPAIGIDHMSVTKTATAELVQGIESESH